MALFSFLYTSTIIWKQWPNLELALGHRFKKLGDLDQKMRREVKYYDSSYLFSMTIYCSNHPLILYGKVSSFILHYMKYTLDKKSTELKVENPPFQKRKGNTYDLLSSFIFYLYDAFFPLLYSVQRGLSTLLVLLCTHM